MVNYIKVSLFAFLFLMFILHQCNRHLLDIQTEDSSVTIDSTNIIVSDDLTIFNTHSEITRQVLITHCGSCHQSSLPTKKAGAIAIFDLDKNAQWHEDLAKHHLSGIGNRLLNNNAITQEQKDAITAFLNAKESNLEH